MLIVSLGAGKHQIPIIHACKDLGFKVVGIDKNPHAEGLNLCDLKIIDSIYNYQELYILLKELLVFDDIAAIVTRSYGDVIKTVAYLCQKFKLPYIDFSNVDNIINKDAFRAIASQCNIPMPDGFILDTIAYKNIHIPLPCIVKPVKGHAKKSVRLISSYDEFRRYLSSVKSKVIIEEYIEGDEIIVIGLVIKNRFYICDISDKILNALPYFIDRMHLLPSKYYTLYHEIQKLGQSITDSFEIINTPLLMECKIKNNQLYLIEAACEFGGEYLADYAIPARLQYNIFKAFINALVNGNFKEPTPSSNAAVVKYIMGRQGKLSSFTIPKHRNLVHSEIFADIGTTLQYPTTNHERLGVIVTKGKTVENAIATADKVLEKMNITID